jgi:pimeloyl-ACP methyl ester carboxylesterase/ketosteroid isomerase-like protein
MSTITLACRLAGLALPFLLLASGTRAQEAPSTAARAFGALQKAALEDGIDQEGYVSIGGIRQWISVRGRHRDAPLLLFLHGGPGFVSTPGAYYFGWLDRVFLGRAMGSARGRQDLRGERSRRGATDDDDRAHGRGRRRRRALPAQDLRLPQIVLVGHSWGSYLGLTLARRHPEWFYAYVGIGQAIDFARSERLGYEATLAAAQRAGNAQAVRELEAMAPFPDAKDPATTLRNLPRERHWLAEYHGSVVHGDESVYDAIGLIGPDYGSKDLEARDAGLRFSLPALWSAMGRIDLESVDRLELPVVFLHGRSDTNVSAQVLAQWYARLQAPSKKLVWFDDAAHLVQEEAPGKTLVTLVQDVLPLTGASGTAAGHDPAQDERDIRRVEAEICRAFQLGDAVTLRPLLDDGFILTSSTGVVTDLAQNLEEVRAREPAYDEFRNHDQIVRLHGDAAIVTGITTVKGRSGGGSFAKDFQFTDTWVRRDGRWLLAASHASALPGR